ncbi:Ig-like domain-containing protein [Chitinophagales bacterium]|nr:Ig-like domain-containing protein [Chitinophagales bacterium]
MIKLIRPIFISLFFGACANPVSPPGGVKDSNPPQVLLEQPANGSTSYKGDRIEFLFDEYINFRGGTEKVLITPHMDPPPSFTLKGKKLVVDLPDNLNPDVTYTINFLNAITDYTENNTLSILQYVFTQGETIDSGSIAGKVVNSFDGLGVENVFIGLFNETDSLEFIKTKPVYVTKSNGQGEFKLDYVKPGYYKILALEDKNFNFALDKANERISLTSESIFITAGGVLDRDLPVFYSKESSRIAGYKVLTNSSLYLFFDSEMEEMTVHVNPPIETDYWYLNTNNDTLFYYWSTPDLEQLDFVLNFTDGAVDSLNIPLLKKEVKEKFRVKLPCHVNNPIRIHTGDFIVNADSALIKVSDTLNNTISYRLDWDRGYLLITPNNALENNLLIQIESGALEFIQGNSNLENTMLKVRFIEQKPRSELILGFNKALPEGAIFELYTNKEKRIKKEQVAGQEKISIADLRTGNYTIRIYQDLNGNNIWDTGDILMQEAPEPTLIYKQGVEIKENWDKELQLNF